MGDAQDAVLIAIDAPLGWPKLLAETLIKHSAGMQIETPANAMFRRTTDVFIQQKLKKTPLDVGADGNILDRSAVILSARGDRRRRSLILRRYIILKF